eukprot:7804189-Pyramimonas_sp.AAC.1
MAPPRSFVRNFLSRTGVVGHVLFLGAVLGLAALLNEALGYAQFVKLHSPAQAYGRSSHSTSVEQ